MNKQYILQRKRLLWIFGESCLKVRKSLLAAEFHTEAWLVLFMNY